MDLDKSIDINDVGVACLVNQNVHPLFKSTSPQLRALLIIYCSKNMSRILNFCWAIYTGYINCIPCILFDSHFSQINKSFMHAVWTVIQGTFVIILIISQFWDTLL